MTKKFLYFYAYFCYLMDMSAHIPEKDDLWKYNFAEVTFVDVTDLYERRRYGLPEVPYDFHLVVSTGLVPVYRLAKGISGLEPEGYCYDWHSEPERTGEAWVVHVVKKDRLREFIP